MDPKGDVQTHPAGQNHLNDQCGKQDTFQHLVSGAVKIPLKGLIMNMLVQQDRISGTPGWLECTKAVNQLLREAKEGKGDLVVLCLDLGIA